MPNRRHPRHEPRHVRITKHELQIRELLASDPAICRYGFAQAVDAIVQEFDCSADCRVNRLFAPDAYRIDRANGWIDIFEVEVTCPISSAKLEKLAAWWEAWDCEGQCDFLPRVFVIDKYGTHEIDLEAAAFA